MPRKRIAVLLAITLLIAGVGVVIYFMADDPATPPAKLHLIVVGMPLVEIVGILGEPKQRGFQGLADDCAIWESPRGMAVVFLDDGECARRVSWFPARQSEWRQVWRYLAG